MTAMATFLEPYNKQQKAYFWLGNGGNGKGTLASLLRYVLGKYWGELEMSYYTTSTRDADKPNQNLYNCRQSRVLFSSELERGENTGTVTFNHQRFCQLTGQDPVYVRKLGSKDTDNFLGGKSLLLLNTMPSFNGVIDDAIRRRIEVWAFPYKFVDTQNEVEADPGKCRLKDPSIVQRFKTPEYAVAFLSILFDYYKTYLKEGLVIPPSVKSYTDEYFEGQSIRPFMEDTFEAQQDSVVDLRIVQTRYNEDTGKKYSIEKLKQHLKAAGFEIAKQSGYWKLKHYRIPLVADQQETEIDYDLEEN